MTDEDFLRQALDQARRAAGQEVPVGAVIVARAGHRAPTTSASASGTSAHAEMQAFTAASEFLGGKFLDQCTLYVTLEPCPMCSGAAYWTRIGRIVYGARDDKRSWTSMASATRGCSTPRRSSWAGSSRRWRNSSSFFRSSGKTERTGDLCAVEHHARLPASLGRGHRRASGRRPPRPVRGTAPRRHRRGVRPPEDEQVQYL